MTICINPQQQRLHVASELVAVLLVAPVTLYMASKATDPTTRAIGMAIGIGTLAVDGWLLLRWISGQTAKPIW